MFIIATVGVLGAVRLCELFAVLRGRLFWGCLNSFSIHIVLVFAVADLNVSLFRLILLLDRFECV